MLFAVEFSDLLQNAGMGGIAMYLIYFFPRTQAAGIRELQKEVQELRDIVRDTRQDTGQKKEWRQSQGTQGQS